MEPSLGQEARDVATAWSQVAATVAAIESTLGKWLLDNHGIGITEYRAALHLSQASDRELRLTELARRVGLNQSSATRLVGRMESKELAFRDTCPGDGRGVYAVITERGLEAIREIQEPYEAKTRELLQKVTKQHPQLDVTGLVHSFNTISKLIS